MLIKHFRERRFRTRDPMRPGQFVIDRRLEGSGTHTMSVEDGTYTANAAGWFDVPDHVAQFWLTRPGWRTPDQVEEAIVAGEIEENDSPLASPPPRPARSARKSQASA